MKRVILSIFFLALGSMHLMAFSLPDRQQKQRTLTLILDHYIGNQLLQLEEPAVNIFGETITIQRFRYYLSNFSITDAKGNITTLPVQYFLIDESEPDSKTIKLSIPDVAISNIGFLLGVDSARNVSGVQTDALDPAKGMFWTWNSGYVMAKLEGVSDVSASAGRRFTYHVGGFRTGMNATRAITLPVDKQQESSALIHISADLNHWFKGNTDLRIAETPVCHSPGELAMRIADNYALLFSVKPGEK